MKPIQLTEFGDYLVAKSLLLRATDKTELANWIGVHDVCGGYINIRPSSKTHNVILCHSCCLRLPIPKKIRTFGDLQAYLHFHIPQAVQ